MVYKLNDKFNFGKHKGEFVQDVIEDDVTYIEWCLDNVEDFELDETLYQIYNDALKSYNLCKDIYVRYT